MRPAWALLAVLLCCGATGVNVYSPATSYTHTSADGELCLTVQTHTAAGPSTWSPRSQPFLPPVCLETPVTWEWDPPTTYVGGAQIPQGTAMWHVLTLQTPEELGNPPPPPPPAVLPPGPVNGGTVSLNVVAQVDPPAGGGPMANVLRDPQVSTSGFRPSFSASLGTVPANASVLVVWGKYDSAAPTTTVTAVDIDGSITGEIVGPNPVTGAPGNRIGAFFIADSGPAGTKTLNVTLGQPFDTIEMYIHAYIVNGLDPNATAPAVVLDATGTAPNPSLTLPGVPAGSFVLSILSAQTNNGSPPTPNLTASDPEFATINWYVSTQYLLEKASAGDQVVSYAADGGAWGMLAMAFAPAGGGGAVTVTPVNLSSDAVVSAPSIGQRHQLTPTDLEAAAAVSSPSIGQRHQLTPTDLEAAAAVSSPVIGQRHQLTPTDLEAAAAVSNPALSTSGEVQPVDLVADVDVTAPAIAQRHQLAPVDVDAASAITNPAVTTAGTLTPVDLVAEAAVSSPAIAQRHQLQVADLEAAAALTNPAISIAITVAPIDTAAGAAISAPAIAQRHQLQPGDLVALADVTAPAILLTPKALRADATLFLQPELRHVAVPYDRRHRSA